MRLVIKPGGIVVLLASMFALVFLAVRNRAASPGPSTETVSAGSRVAPALPIGRTKTRQVLAPDIASQNWRLLVTPENGEASQGIVNARVPGHPVARQISIKKVGTDPWAIQTAHPLNAAFKKGQHLRLTYFARSPESCPINAVVEQATEPYEKLSYSQAQLTPEWVQYSEEWDQAKDAPANWAHIDFQVGAKPGTVEITGVAIVAVEAG